MITTTTPTLEGRSVTQYLGIVTGESIIGANIFRDLFADIQGLRPERERRGPLSRPGLPQPRVRDGVLLIITFV